MNSNSGSTNLFGMLLIEYAFPIAMIGGLGVAAWWLYQQRDNVPIESPVKSVIAYTKDHPLAALMLSASIALSVVSFWNTWAGMTDVLGNPIMSVLATIGIQGLMLVFAWKLGFDLFSRNGAAAAASVLFSVLAYASAMFLSSGFAAVKMFDVVFDKNQRALWSEIRTDGEVREILGELGRLNEERLAEERIAFTAAPDSPWRTVEANISSVSDRETALREDLRQKSEAAAAERAAKEAERIQLSGNLEQAQIDLAGAVAETQRLEENLNSDRAALAAWRKEFGPLQAQVRNLEAQIKDEVAGERSSGRTGCGDVCKDLQAKLKPIQDQYDSGPKQEFERLESEIKAAEAGLKDARIRQISFQANVDTLKSTAGAVPDLPQASDPVADFARLSAAGTLRDLAQRFASDPNQPDYDLLRSQCALVEASPSASGPQQRCDLALAEAQALRLIALNEGSKYLTAGCTLDNLGQPEDGMRVRAMTNLAETCISQSGLLASETNALRTRIINVKRNRAEDAPKFSLIQTALGDGEKLAWLAVVLAILIDFLVLFSALLGVLVMHDKMQQSGLTRSEATAVRNALLAHPNVRQQDLASIFLQTVRGPSGHAPGFAVIDSSRLGAQDRPLLLGVVTAANDAQYRRSAQEMRVLGWAFAGVCVTLAGLFAGGVIGAAIAACSMAGFWVVNLRLVRGAQERQNSSGLKDTRGIPLPRLVHVHQDGATQEIAISGMLQQALQIAAREEDNAQTRHRNAVRRARLEAARTARRTANAENVINMEDVLRAASSRQDENA